MDMGQIEIARVEELDMDDVILAFHEIEATDVYTVVYVERAPLQSGTSDLVNVLCRTRHGGEVSRYIESSACVVRQVR